MTRGGGEGTGNGKGPLDGRGLLLALSIAATVAGCGDKGVGTQASSKQYAGSAGCAPCHPAEHAAWRRSAHAAALQAASPALVQARFDGELRRFASLAFRPVRRGARLYFELPSSGAQRGAPRSFRLAYVLGREEIEQFLTPASGGRLQALPVGYDTERREWFDIFPEAPAPEAWEHWKNPGMTANSRCLPCHTTGYAKGFDPAAGTYATRWAEAGVGCEACHGPGGEHAAGEKGEPGFYGALSSRAQAMESCAPCHRVRVEIAAGFTPGASLADFFTTDLLETSLYHADGQLAGEGFEWTSFRMSRMARAGVVCQDCHEPHAARLMAEGDALCLRCHGPEFARTAHTHHRARGRGARCVGCHMPPVVFMERDERHDHRIAPPDPGGASAVGAPGACSSCHTDERPAWAARWVAEWYGRGAPRALERETARGLEAGREGLPGAGRGLVALLEGDVDAVRRASAARLLSGWAGEEEVRRALLRAATDPDPLVRAGAVASLGAAGAAQIEVRRALLRAVGDPLRLVRIEAAFALRGVRPEELGAEAASSLAAASREWVAAQALAAELPGPNHNLGIYFAARGEIAAAEAAYRAALRRWPPYLPSHQNLALLLATTGREAEAERHWRTLLALSPGFPPAAFSLGLLYARQQRFAEAASQLEAVLARDPAYPGARERLAAAYAGLAKANDAQAPGPPAPPPPAAAALGEGGGDAQPRAAAGQESPEPARKQAAPGKAASRRPLIGSARLADMPASSPGHSAR